MNVVVWDSAIAGAGPPGGIMLDTWEAASFPWAVLGLATAGFPIAWRACSRGFHRGHRLGHGQGIKNSMWMGWGHLSTFRKNQEKTPSS